MECPKCQYALSDFDINCPRCKNFADLGLSVPASSIVEEAGAPESPVGSEKAWYSKLDLMDADLAADPAPSVQEDSHPIVPSVPLISPVPQFQRLPSRSVSTPVLKASSSPVITPVLSGVLPGGDTNPLPISMPAASSHTKRRAGKTPTFAVAGLAVAVGAIWFVVHSDIVSHEPQAESSRMREAQKTVAQAASKAQAASALVSEVANSITYDKSLTLTDQQAAALRTGLRAKCRSALDDCAQALQADPRNVAALAARVRALRYLGDAKSADISLSNALKTRPNNPLLLELKGNPK